MTTPGIGIIVSPAAKARLGSRVAEWVGSTATRRDDLAFENVDLRDHPTPFFNETISPAYAPLKDEAA